MATIFALFILACGAVFAVFTIALWRKHKARLDRLAPKSPAAAPANGNGLAQPHSAGYRFTTDGLRPRPRLPRILPREFTSESVTGLGQLASPRRSRRARHVGIVTRTRRARSGRAYARLTYVNRGGSIMLPLGTLRRVN